MDIVEVEKKTAYSQEIAEVQDLTGLENVLTKIQKAQSNESALTYSIKAQIKVISVLNSPKMLENPFSMMIEQLNRAIQYAENENEKREIQHRASIMMTNMAFFMEARLRYEKDKHSEIGKEYLEEGCNLLARSIVDIVPQEDSSLIEHGAKAAGALAVKYEPSLLAAQLAMNLFNSLAKGKDGIVFKLAEWWNKKENNEKNQAEYEDFIESFIDKIDEHHEVFGKSIILSEFVRDKKEMLVNGRTAGIKPKEPIGSTLRGIFRPILALIIIAISLILSIPLISSLDLTDVHKYIVSLIPSIIAIVFIAILARDKMATDAERNLYKEAVDAFKKYKQNISKYYNSVYAKVSIAKNSTSDNDELKLEIEQPPLVLDDYKIYRKKRYRSITENKITAGVLSFPPLVLFIFYNFYLSYKTSASFILLMLILGLAVSCAVFVWSLIDFNLLQRRIDGKWAMKIVDYFILFRGTLALGVLVLGLSILSISWIIPRFLLESIMEMLK
ncbi:MAG: hypothetical protein FWH22_06605 [Fibromonadales bacterium]|nr:hypothetical protein [Fibromonadales bacterium]